MPDEIRPDRRSRFAISFLFAIVLAGCHSAPSVELPAPVRVKTQDEAATVLVTTSMVAPWANVSAALKPAFTMTGDAAVSEVLPTTEQIQSQVLNAFGASLGVGLPGTAATSATATTTNSGAAPPPPSGTPAGGQMPAAPVLAGNLGLDPVLKYKAAAYLNQEVQLLNQEIDNAAVRDCFVPYVVKLKLAVMNYRPYLAYSIHTRVSFAPGPGGDYPAAGVELTQAADTLRAAGLFADMGPASTAAPTGSDTARVYSAEQRERLAQVARKLQAEHTSPTCLELNHSPVVVPFLVADDMEVALKSRATEAARQIAFALNFMAHGVGGNAGFNNLSTALTAVSSQDLSSALTVARDNDSTLYIHIAPNNQASGEPSLVGQTYDVAVLLLVPRRYFVWRGDHFDPATISLVSYTQFRDASTGEVLASRPVRTLAADLDRILMPFISADQKRSEWWNGLEPQEKKVAEAEGLMGAIVAGNPEDFRANLAGGSACDRKADILQSLCLDPGYGPSLWASLSSVLSDNSYKSASFEAPIPARITIPTQTLLVTDDKTHPIQVLVGGVGGESAATLAAHLNVMTKTAAGSTVISIPAQSLALDDTAHVLTLTFPSLSKSGLSMSPPKPSKPRKQPAVEPAPEGLGIVLGAAENAVVIERVNCDPLKALCPELAGESQGRPLPTGGTADHPAVTLPVQLTSVAKAPAASIAKLASSGNAIAINRDSSTGVLPLLVSVPATGLPTGDTLALTVSGAPVVAALGASGAVLSLGKNGYVLPQAGLYTLNLVNLMPGTAVTVSVQTIKADGKTPDGDPATASFTAIPAAPVRP